MKYSIKKLKTKANIAIQFEDSDFEKADKIAVRYFAQNIKVSGFRKGSVPRSIVITKVGEATFDAEVKNILLNLAYTEIVKIEKLEPLMEPSIKKSSDDFHAIEMEVDLYPEIDLSFLENISVKRNDINVEDKDIDETLNEIIKHNSRYKEVYRPAKKQDKVEIDFDGFDEKNVPIKGASSKNHPIIIGMNTFIPGFEDQLVSMKKGDKKEFKLRFPDNYGSKDLAGKEVKFVVSMKRIEEPVKIEMDDNFAKEVSQGLAKNMKELRNIISTRLLEKKRYDEEQNFQTKVIDEFYKNLKFDLPDKFVDEEKKHLKSSLENDLSSKGYTMEQYYASRKIDKKKLDSELREQALKRLKINLGLRKIIDNEKISLTKKEIESIKTSLDKDKNLEHAKSEMIFQKALSYLFTKCDVKKT